MSADTELNEALKAYRGEYGKLDGCQSQMRKKLMDANHARLRADYPKNDPIKVPDIEVLYAICAAVSALSLLFMAFYG